ncbi:glutamate ABC transporter substrate-binding protein [Catellatospora sichuanensis]|uniref:glutamate ABC transporter substrate-binding protein n=1 Tax=Catellatospora sichuanensis TaxID=1969805 RepID=UPI0011839BAF|nr:glutamate ABC transporter substrate-binding protein [Catellatospora sichuanensis]
MRMKRLAAVAAVALLALGAAACGTDTETPSTPSGESPLVGKATAGSLKFGVKADQPGLGLQAGAAYEGFDIEIAKIIAKGLGGDPAKNTYVTTVSANREPFIQSGQVDIVVATYTINDDRKKKVNFAGPYFTAGQDLLVKVDSTIAGPEGLDGKKVCSVTGSTPAKRIKEKFPKVQLQEFDAYSKCVEALANGTVDAVTTDDIILAGYASQAQYVGKFKVVGKPFSSEPYGIGLKLEDKAGCTKINEILKESVTNGSYKAAWDATLGKSGTPAPTLDVSKLTNCPA